MLKTLLFSAAFLNTMVAFSQQPDLSADRIPDSLKKNAAAVVRVSNEIFELKDIDKASYRVHKIVTVLSQVGDGYLDFEFEGDKFHKLAELEIKVYDANGKQISKFKKKDLLTYNIGEGLIDDGIRNFLFIPRTGYPITIETDIEIAFRGLLGVPGYRIATPHVSVMHSSYTAIVPKELGIRFKAKNSDITPDKTEQEKTFTYTWNVKNQPAIFYEDGTVTRGKSYPQVLIGPNRFKIDNYEGDMSSWKNYGAWYNTVCAGTQTLNEDRIKFYSGMVKDATTNREKVAIIYEYLQQNFRYVSIQLGIGGHRPLPASFTDEKKYGDCKGLSNYVLAVLKGLGIKSYLVLINRAANDEPVDIDFPAPQFNHAILMVPDAKDSIWLECTSKHALFGKLDISTENRNAVLITENGGVLVNTPASDPANNLFSVKSKIELLETGSGSCVSSIQGTGEFKEELLNALSGSKRDDQKTYLVKRIGYKQPDELEVSRVADLKGFSTNINLAIEKIPEFMAGSKMFLAPHIYKFWTEKLPATEKRQRDYFFSMPFRKSDTTFYKLPAGYIIDLLPTGKSFSCSAASYSTSFSFSEKDAIICSITNLELRKHKVVPAEYQNTKEFFDKVAREESQRIVIRKSDETKLKAF